MTARGIIHGNTIVIAGLLPFHDGEEVHLNIHSSARARRLQEHPKPSEPV